MNMNEKINAVATFFLLKRNKLIDEDESSSSDEDIIIAHSSRNEKHQKIQKYTETIKTYSEEPFLNYF